MHAIARILADAGRPSLRSPFDIICGTSAGALNATALACRADDFASAVRGLLAVWEGVAAHHVYRADSLAVLRSGARWLSLLSFGWLLRKWHASPPQSLLDNTPLAGLLHRALDLPRLDAALADGVLHALAITASSYSSGRHITFYQAAREIAPWTRHQRVALPTQISVEHLLASSAIPAAFPPVELDGHLYCDGAVTSNILYNANMRSTSSVLYRWQVRYPELRLPRIRFWVIINAQLEQVPRIVQPNWLDVTASATETIVRAATAQSIRRFMPSMTQHPPSVSSCKHRHRKVALEELH